MSFSPEVTGLKLLHHDCDDAGFIRIVSHRQNSLYSFYYVVPTHLDHLQVCTRNSSCNRLIFSSRYFGAHTLRSSIISTNQGLTYSNVLADLSWSFFRRSSKPHSLHFSHGEGQLTLSSFRALSIHIVHQCGKISLSGGPLHSLLLHLKVPADHLRGRAYYTTSPSAHAEEPHIMPISSAMASNWDGMESSTFSASESTWTSGAINHQTPSSQMLLFSWSFGKKRSRRQLSINGMTFVVCRLPDDNS